MSESTSLPFARHSVAYITLDLRTQPPRYILKLEGDAIVILSHCEVGLEGSILVDGRRGGVTAFGCEPGWTCAWAAHPVGYSHAMVRYGWQCVAGASVVLTETLVE